MTQHSINTIVFSGPSLPPAQLETLMPEAHYHHPVRCGDILRCLRLKPKQLVIIDGYFETSAAVWHKEILYALQQGVQVFGAGSIGALRAAELAAFGMFGIGEIFQLYYTGEIIGDDEVTLVHQSREQQFHSHIIPLINMRFTLKFALENERISKETENAILKKAKLLPYYARSWDAVCEDSTLAQWLQTHTVDQKNLDAVALIKAIKNQAIPRTKSNPPTAKETLFIKKLIRETVTTAFDADYPWLPPHEKQFYQLMKAPFSRHIALHLKLMMIMQDIAEKEHDHSHITPSLILKRFWKNQKTRKFHHFMLLHFQLNADSLDKLQLNLLNLNIQLLSELMDYLKENQMELSTQQQQSISNQFREREKLLTSEQTHHWIAKQLKDEADYKEFIEFITLIQYVFSNNISEFIGLPLSSKYKTLVHDFSTENARWTKMPKAELASSAFSENL